MFCSHLHCEHVWVTAYHSVSFSLRCIQSCAELPLIILASYRVYSSSFASHRLTSSSDSLGLSYGTWSCNQPDRTLRYNEQSIATHHVASSIYRRKRERASTAHHACHLAVHRPITQGFSDECVLASPFERERHALVADLIDSGAGKIRTSCLTRRPK